MPFRRSLLIVPIAAALALAGCGEKTVARKDVESKVKDSLAKTVGTAPKSIDCPGDLKAKVGARMTCTLTAPDDSKLDVNLDVYKLRGSKALFNIKVGTQVRR